MEDPGYVPYEMLVVNERNYKEVAEKTNQDSLELLAKVRNAHRNNEVFVVYLYKGTW